MMTMFLTHAFMNSAKAQTADSALVVTDSSVTTSSNVVVTDSSGTTTLFAGGQQSNYSGMVGVGTSTPAVKLHVYDDYKANFRLSQRVSHDSTQATARSSNHQHTAQSMISHTGLIQGNGQHLFGQQIMGNNGQPIDNFDISILSEPLGGTYGRQGDAVLSTFGNNYTGISTVNVAAYTIPNLSTFCPQSADGSMQFMSASFGWLTYELDGSGCPTPTADVQMVMDNAGDLQLVNGSFTVGNDIFKVNKHDRITYAREIKVQAAPFPADFVFEKEYKMMGLHDLENYVNANHHLPEIPSADEQKKDGVNVADMQNKLLQKIEELTLIVIEQNKRIDELEKQAKH